MLFLASKLSSMPLLSPWTSICRQRVPCFLNPTPFRIAEIALRSSRCRRPEPPYVLVAVSVCLSLSVCPSVFVCLPACLPACLAVRLCRFSHSRSRTLSVSRSLLLSHSLTLSLSLSLSPSLSLSRAWGTGPALSFAHSLAPSLTLQLALALCLTVSLYLNKGIITSTSSGSCAHTSTHSHTG